MDHKNKFYVTTPIYYVNAKPHLGSLYSTLLADAAARWHALQGEKVFFMTGTDEYGQKIAQAAHKADKEPQEFVDSFLDSFKDLWHAYNINYTFFARTTSKHHIKAVQDWLKKLIEKGEIYKSFYTAWYCVHCEAYLTDKEAENQRNGIPLCPTCGRETQQVSEESYFFRLSAYQDRLLEFYKNCPDFITPSERLHEVVRFVESGLKDLSISRTTLSWGIPFPDDEMHVTYVWAEALNIYITSVGYGDPHRKDEFEFWWPADLQVMGKDIVRFHAVYWPAFLMASGLALPKKLLVHGWIKIGEQKMSKSLGNAIDPHLLRETYGTDPVRYYLIRYMAITHDSPFSSGDLENRINSDLADDLGNLLNRVLILAQKNNVMHIEKFENLELSEIDLRDLFWSCLEVFEYDMSDYFFHRAYANLWAFLKNLNHYLHVQEPWKKSAKSDPEKLKRVISAACHGLYAVAVLLWPVMPQTMEKLAECLGLTIPLENNIIEQLKSEPWHREFNLTVCPPLFEKYGVEEREGIVIPKETLQPEKITTEEKIIPTISIDVFNQVELVVGTIEQVEDIAKSDKLYVLQVNFGVRGFRQICSGIKKHFAKEDLLGKQGIFVFNLAPRKMIGYESNGMMLLAESEDGTLKMSTIDGIVTNGTRLR